MATELVQIPLLQGQSEGVDPKLLPQGWLHSAVNVRFRRDGRLGARAGWKAEPFTNKTFGAFGNAEYSYPQMLARRGGQTIAAVAGRAWLYAEEAAGWTQRQHVSHWRPRSKRWVSTDTETPLFPSAAVHDGYIVHVWRQGTTVVASVEDEDTGAIVAAQELGSCFIVHVVVLSAANIIAVVWTDGTTIRQRNFDTTQTGTLQFSATTHTVATGVVTGGMDVAPIPGSANYLLSYQASATTVRIQDTNSSGASVAGATETVASGTHATACHAGATSRWLVTLQQLSTGAVVLRSWSATYTNLSGPTTIETDASNTNAPTIGGPVNRFAFPGTDRVWVAWSRAAGASALGRGMRAELYSRTGTAHSASGVSRLYHGLQHVSKTFAPTLTGSLTEGPTYIWGVSLQWRKDQASYYMIDLWGEGHWASAGDSGAYHGRTAFGEAFNTMIGFAAAPVLTTRGWLWDHSRIVRGVPSAPSSTFIQLGVASIIWEHYWQGAKQAHRRGVEVGGALYIPGSSMAIWDGKDCTELGFAYGPEIVSLTPSSSSGALTSSGVYRYVAVYEWIDALGQRHQSAPSVPVEVTLGASDNRVTVTVPSLVVTSKGISDNRVLSGTPFTQIQIYRTTASGRIYHRVSLASPPSARQVNGTVSFVDDMADTVADDQEILYTQGNVLPHEAPPACSYLATNGERLLAGGLEDAAMVQWSKIIVPGEPVQWADHDAFRARVGGPVTAVAALDSRWVVFTERDIYLIAGDGPNDQGVGAFTEPQKLPSETGCTNARSLVETAQGLMFEGSDTRVWLLPRGGGAPQWIGQPVRDTLEEFPVIYDAAFNRSDHSAMFAVGNAASSEGRVLVYDTRAQAWLTDQIPKRVGSTPIAFAYLADLPRGFSGMRWNGTTFAYLEQSQTFDTVDGQNRFVATELETGDITPFGPLGWGRCFSATILTEGGGANLQIQISYDSGTTWPASKSWVGSGINARTWHPARAKGRAFRYRIGATDAGGLGAGPVFNALTLEVERQPSTPRLQAGLRG